MIVFFLAFVYEFRSNSMFSQFFCNLFQKLEDFRSYIVLLSRKTFLRGLLTCFTIFASKSFVTFASVVINTILAFTNSIACFSSTIIYVWVKKSLVIEYLEIWWSHPMKVMTTKCHIKKIFDYNGDETNAELALFSMFMLISWSKGR